ncbi:MAG: leucine-rich repeat domain-containing protein, partial [Promethearchaeota archaeon]
MKLKHQKRKRNSDKHVPYFMNKERYSKSARMHELWGRLGGYGRRINWRHFFKELFRPYIIQSFNEVFQHKAYIIIEGSQYRNAKILRQLHGVNKLLIRKCKFKRFPRDVLKSVKSLTVLTCEFRRFPSHLFPNLEELHISASLIKKPMDFLSECPNLKILTVGRCISKEMLKSLPNLNHLEFLVIQDNFYDDKRPYFEFPTNFGEIPNLKRLEMNGLNVKEFPASFGNLKSLEEIRFMHLRHSDLPESIGELSNLRILEIYYSNLRKIPECIRKLKNLRRLVMSSCRIDKLPDSICELSELEELELRHNQLTHLPDNIGELRNLKSLLLDGNLLVDLPESFQKFGNIEYLGL